MSPVIHAIWNNLFTCLAVLVSGAFLLALALSHLEEKRESRELLEICMRLRRQRRRERLQGGQLEELTRSFQAVDSDGSARTIGLFKVFRWKFVLFAVISITAVALVRKDQASDRPAPAPGIQSAAPVGPVPAGTSIPASDTTADLSPATDLTRPGQRLNFDYDHATIWEEQSPKASPVSIALDKDWQQPEAANPLNCNAEPHTLPAWSASKPAKIAIRGKK